MIIIQLIALIVLIKIAFDVEKIKKYQKALWEKAFK